MIDPIPYHHLTEERARAGCLVTGMPNAAYHAFPGISKSGLDLIARSPAHYRYAAKREPTRAMEIGTAIHTAVLEPERFASEYVLLRDVKDRRASEYREAAKVHGTERVLVAKEADNVAAMQESVLAQYGDVLAQESWKELSVFATDPETGCLCKARFDWVSVAGLAIDLKKTQDTHADEFAKTVARYRYHVQDPFYSDVWMWAVGHALDAFKFLAVEEHPPHTANLYNLDDEGRDYGRKLYREDLNRYAECMESGEWPHYQPESELLGLPFWALPDADSDEFVFSDDDVEESA